METTTYHPPLQLEKCKDQVRRERRLRSETLTQQVKGIRMMIVDTWWAFCLQGLWANQSSPARVGRVSRGTQHGGRPPRGSQRLPIPGRVPLKAAASFNHSTFIR